MLTENNLPAPRSPVPKLTPLLSGSKKDWVFATLLFLITCVVTVTYYLNHPAPEVYPDSLEYIALAHHIQATGQVLDPHRLPGFPLLIALIFSLSGRDNLVGVQIANAILFVWSVMELYLITLLLFENTPIAFLVGLLIGTNAVMLSFIKPIASEALALWFLVTMALATLRFLQTYHKRYLWLAACYMLGLFFTRAEWIYVPLPFMLFLLFCAWCQKQPLRPILLHSLAAFAVLYAILGGYIYANYKVNQVASITDIQSINELGKVLQYNMQNDAAPQYASLAHLVDTFHAHGNLNPYDLLAQHPELKNNHYTTLGAYCQSIIVHDFPQFIIKTLILTVHTIPDFYLESKVNPNGLLALPLTLLQNVYHLLYKANILYLLSILPWLVLIVRKRSNSLYMVQASALLILLSACGILFSTLGGYDSYPRFHAPLNPFLIILIWGSAMLALRYLASQTGRQTVLAFFQRSRQQSSIASQQPPTHSQLALAMPATQSFSTSQPLAMPATRSFSTSQPLAMPSTRSFSTSQPLAMPSTQSPSLSQGGLSRPWTPFLFPPESGVRRQFHFPSQSGIQDPSTLPGVPSQGESQDLSTGQGNLLQVDAWQERSPDSWQAS
ncbi:MAG TPA: hypothetical protein VFB12_19730 [Ktedonobacteraceae bacterium]|nr:hypothetical protein [Ktedonobacteraceae bacterium]